MTTTLFAGRSLLGDKTKNFASRASATLPPSLITSSCAFLRLQNRRSTVKTTDCSLVACLRYYFGNFRINCVQLSHPLVVESTNPFCCVGNRSVPEVTSLSAFMQNFTATCFVGVQSTPPRGRSPQFNCSASGAPNVYMLKEKDD